MKKINIVFGIQNEIRAHQLENEFDILSKFKTLRLLLEGCKVKKEYGSLIYSILVKLGPHTCICFHLPFH